MGRTPWAMYLWPGLPHLWRRADWSGLVVAVVFAALLNAALLSTIVWSEYELFVPAGRKIIWLAVLAMWVGSTAYSANWQRRHPDVPKPLATENSEDAFAEALEHYLQQDWYEAERLLGQLLRYDVRDVDSRLMLATVLRRTQRFDEAAGQLDRLSRMENAQKWEQEIFQERARLAEAMAGSDDKAAEREHALNEPKKAA